MPGVSPYQKQASSMKLAYTIIYVPNVTATVEFYEAAFGIARRFIHESGTYAELETGATALAFADEAFVAESLHEFRRNRPTDAPCGAEVGFVVDDVASAFAQAVAAGARPSVEPMRKPWGQTVSYVRDLNGFLVELCTKVSGSES